MSLDAQIIQNIFKADEICNVEIILLSKETLLPGDNLEVQFPNAWLIVSGPSFTRDIQYHNSTAEHYIEVVAENPSAKFKIEIFPCHLTFPEGLARHGRRIVATLTEGTVQPNVPVYIRYKNTYSPYIAHTDSVWVKFKNESPDKMPSLTVRSLESEVFRIIVPSCVLPGQNFNLLLVSLDKFGNCSCTSYQNQKVYTTKGKLIADNLSFTGKYLLSVQLDSEGVYRFKMGETISNAIRVGTELNGPYWGDIHIHTKLSFDAQGNEPYEYARDVSGLDFAATADHVESLGPQGCEQLLKWARNAAIPGKFVTILADERNPKAFQGHHNIYFRDEESFQLHKIASNNNPADFDSSEKCGISNLNPASVMLIPHHTGIIFGNARDGEKGSSIDFDAYDDLGTRPVIEIYSHHGQSELFNPQHILAYEFNRMRNPERRANVSAFGMYYAQDYWKNGHKLGTIASSDNHEGQGGRPHGGIVGVWCNRLTTEGVFDAIKNKHCYGTTGERILIDFSINGIKMGDSGKKIRNKKLSIKLQVWGTDILLRVEILRYRFDRDSDFIPIISELPKPETTDYFCDLEEDFLGDCMYYARVIQEPLSWPDMAWTSPIWLEENK